jgi:hypothetical protein
MTFTLVGRWQIRLLLLATIGLLMTISISIRSGGAIGERTSIVLIYLTGFGLCWDLLYHQLQRWRWDGDWNGLLQLGGAIWEGLFLVALIQLGLPGLDRSNFQLAGFIGFYSLFCLLNFAIGHTLLRILAPYSRFNGGKWL